MLNALSCGQLQLLAQRTVCCAGPADCSEIRKTRVKNGEAQLDTQTAPQPDAATPAYLVPDRCIQLTCMRDVMATRDACRHWPGCRRAGPALGIPAGAAGNCLRILGHSSLPSHGGFLPVRNRRPQQCSFNSAECAGLWTAATACSTDGVLRGACRLQ